MQSSNKIRLGQIEPIDKNTVGLGNVDNTSDADKPISTATQNALDNKADRDGGNATGNLATTIANSHTHSNKSVLDNLTQSVIDNSHTHTNKSILDATTASYTTAEKSKLAGIEAGAQVNVKADWNATSGDAEILNKPNTFTPSGHTHPISDITGLQAELNTKLESADLDGFIYDVQYNSSIHTITFYQQNEPNLVIDLPIEQLIKGVQLVGNDLVFTFEDNTTVTVPLNTLLVGVVKSVNGLTPNSQGEIILNVADIPNLSNALNNKLDIRMADLVSDLTQSEKDAICTKLGIVNSIVSQAEAEAGTATTARNWTAQRVRQAILGWWNSVTSAWGRGFVNSTDAAAGRTALGLENVDNTSDADKPISTATQNALNNKQDTLVSGVNIKTVNGQSILGTGSIIGLALGETSFTAYRGDRGKIAYDHSQLTNGNPHNVTKTDVGLSNVDNTSDANKPISTATLTALNGKEDVSKKVQDLSSPDSTTYPSTQAVYDAMQIIIHSRVVNTTYTSLKDLKDNNNLQKGVRYYITDRDIWIDALDTDKLAMECKRHFRIVRDEHYTPHTVTSGTTTRDYLGIYGQTYDRGSVPNSVSNQFGNTTYYTIWGGRMWSRASVGADVPGSSDTTIAGGWVMQNTISNIFYESKIFDVKYDFDNDLIWEQSDDRGNKIKRVSSSTSYIDITDWGNTNIYNNENSGIFNNFRSSVKATIYNNSNSGAIYNNSNNGTINGNSNDSYIRSNSNNGSISSNSNNGYIWDNSNNGNIINNSNNGYIRYNSSSGSTSFIIRNNMNNGYINGNNSTSNINIQYNINNGNIGSTSITDRSSSIQDTQVNK